MIGRSKEYKQKIKKSHGDGTYSSDQFGKLGQILFWKKV